MLEKNSKLPDPDHPRILPFLVKLDIRHQTLDIRLDPDHPCILPFLVQRQSILTILASFLFWFKTKHPVHPYLLPFLVQTNSTMPSKKS